MICWFLMKIPLFLYSYKDSMRDYVWWGKNWLSLNNLFTINHIVASLHYIILLHDCGGKKKNLNLKTWAENRILSVMLVLATGGGAAAGQGGSAKPQGQFFWSRPPASHAGHSGAGRVQPHGPITLSGKPAQTRQRGTPNTHTLTHTAATL